MGRRQPWFSFLDESFPNTREAMAWGKHLLHRLSSRVSLDMMSVQANTGPPWESKNTTAVWRGRDSRKERLELVKLSRKHPELIDAAFTNFFFFKHDESLYGPIVKHISFFDFFKVGHHPEPVLCDFPNTCICVLGHFCCVRLFMTLWTVTCQVHLSVGFSRQEYWSGLPFPSPEDLPDPEVKSMSLLSPALAGGLFTTRATWEVPPAFGGWEIKVNYR